MRARRAQLQAARCNSTGWPCLKHAASRGGAGGGGDSEGASTAARASPSLPPASPFPSRCHHDPHARRPCRSPRLGAGPCARQARVPAARCALLDGELRQVSGASGLLCRQGRPRRRPRRGLRCVRRCVCRFCYLCTAAQMEQRPALPNVVHSCAFRLASPRRTQLTRDRVQVDPVARLLGRRCRRCRDALPQRRAALPGGRAEEVPDPQVRMRTCTDLCARPDSLCLCATNSDFYAGTSLLRAVQPPLADKRALQTRRRTPTSPSKGQGGTGAAGRGEPRCGGNAGHLCPRGTAMPAAEHARHARLAAGEADVAVQTAGVGQDEVRRRRGAHARLSRVRPFGTAHADTSAQAAASPAGISAAVGRVGMSLQLQAQLDAARLEGAGVHEHERARLAEAGQQHDAGIMALGFCKGRGS